MTTKISREDLYNLVWSKPMTKVSAELAISDVGLKKVCKKYEIPTPPLGYWAKRAHGKAIHQPPLPPKPNNQPEFIAISGSPVIVPEEVKEILGSDTYNEQIAKLNQSLKDGVSLEAKDLQPSIRTTAKTLRSQKPAADGNIHATKDGCCGVIVGPESIERTIKILEFIARLSKDQGLILEPVGSLYDQGQ